ncbi:MAG: hypothetical protein HC837_04325 [Chloroflexaceae bacterium]|nr:hypothetical protein [Chloroflexaceae bacterium]
MRHAPIAQAVQRFDTQLRPAYTALQQALGHGIAEAEGRRGALRLLSRLAALWFLQQAGLLYEDRTYLQRRLAEQDGQETYGQHVLWPLLLSAQQTASGRAAIALPPLFQPGIEQDDSVFLPNGLFERIFAVFQQYQWCLDDHAPLTAQTVTPQVLVLVLDRYLHQKALGAYATEEDVTASLCQQTIVPALLDAIARREGTFFDTCRHFLQQHPERYIYPALRYGCDVPLPPEVAAGLHEPGGLIERPPAAYARPTETWRDVIHRRQRSARIHKALVQGQIRSTNDLLPYHLNVAQLLQDMIDQCVEPSLIAACWQALQEVSILDPTCGSGQFLVSALHLLEPFYHSCLRRMERFEGDQQAWQADMDQPPGRDFWVTRTILERNLYGVDLLPEAIEICTMRLLLPLIARMPGPVHGSCLADMCLALRVGNALIGEIGPDSGAARDDARTGQSDQQPLHWHLAFPSVMARGGFDVIIGNPPFVEYRAALRQQYQLAGYATLACGNVHAYVAERCCQLSHPQSYLGLILPLPAIHTRRMRSLQQLLKPQPGEPGHSLLIAAFDERPARLFAGVDQRLITLLRGPLVAEPLLATTGLNRWTATERQELFQLLAYTVQPADIVQLTPFVLKVQDDCEMDILRAFYRNEPLGVLSLHRGDPACAGLSKRWRSLLEGISGSSI